MISVVLRPTVTPMPARNLSARIRETSRMVARTTQVAKMQYWSSTDPTSILRKETAARMDTTRAVAGAVVGKANTTGAVVGTTLPSRKAGLAETQVLAAR